ARRRFDLRGIAAAHDRRKRGIVIHIRSGQSGRCDPSGEPVMNERRGTRYAAGSEKPLASTASDAAFAGKRIPVVEDDPGSRRALTNVLEDRGYNVAAVGTITDALDTLREKPLPHLIVLDLMLPDMEGWDFRHEQKKDPAMASIPVIGVS